jgi:hypothetical protein
VRRRPRHQSTILLCAAPVFHGTQFGGLNRRPQRHRPGTDPGLRQGEAIVNNEIKDIRAKVAMANTTANHAAPERPHARRDRANTAASRTRSPVTARGKRVRRLKPAKCRGHGSQFWGLPANPKNSYRTYSIEFIRGCRLLECRFRKVSPWPNLTRLVLITRFAIPPAISKTLHTGASRP